MIEINNLTKERIDKKALIKAAEGVLKKEKKSGLDLSIALVGQSRIKELNKIYRKKDKPTDVLSFSYYDSLGHSPVSEAGEIVICLSEVKKNAKKSGISSQRELIHILIHGVLHVLGHDHEKSKREAEIMRKKEEYYSSVFGKQFNALN
ncbi:MAG: rRNA maturation RNase YbeY [Candidatus Pacebacteria bacterium]|nr:rRNA maturation RNase YbeY [Candidatus Paceibacterota bacterium]